MNNKYEEMSDFEINYLVAKIATVGEVISKDDMWPVDNANAVQVIYRVGVSGEYKDYCNDPADMWPIIFEYGIEISPLYRGEWCASYISEYTYNEDPIYGLQFSGENPLRAAAIVFLMLKDGE